MASAMHARGVFIAGTLLAGVLSLSPGCRAPRFVPYASPDGDYACDVPWGWTLFRDTQGRDFSSLTVAGPKEPDFYKGLPSLSVRWHRAGKAHRLPDGSREVYASAEDFIAQLKRDVYGPDGRLWAGSDREIAAALARKEPLPASERVKVSERAGTYFVAHRALPAPDDQFYGVVSDGAGHRVVLQRHGYLLVSVKEGFYVLVYPATRAGFEKYRPAFFRLINSFKLLKEGP